MPLNDGRKWLNTVTQVVVVVVGIAVVMAIILPGHVYRRHDYREVQLKSCLHNIQLSVERFAVDTEGSYPQYLIGGEPGNAGADLASDPLIRTGYLDAYPSNPFSPKQDQYQKKTVLELQHELSKCRYGPDPLRPGNPDGDRYGYRFGNDGTLMGQVLCNARLTTRQYEDPVTGEISQVPTWADVEYRFWDMWKSSKPEPFMPGQFFYKGVGPIISTSEDVEPDAEKWILPTEIDQYMLGVYGSLKSKGKDILGGEQDSCWFRKGRNNLKYSLRTNSELAPSGHAGSPFGSRNESELMNGNPNGIRDGIILVLTAGEDYIGDR